MQADMEGLAARHLVGIKSAPPVPDPTETMARLSAFVVATSNSGARVAPFWPAGYALPVQDFCGKLSCAKLRRTTRNQTDPQVGEQPVQRVARPKRSGGMVLAGLNVTLDPESLEVAAGSGLS
jgi:hypothetical protein